MSKRRSEDIKQLDDVEGLLVVAEGLIGAMQLSELADTQACIRDSLKEVRHVRHMLTQRDEGAQ